MIVFPSALHGGGGYFHVTFDDDNILFVDDFVAPKEMLKPWHKNVPFLAITNNVWWNIADMEPTPSEFWAKVFFLIKDDPEKIQNLKEAFFLSVEFVDLHKKPNREKLLEKHNPNLYFYYQRLIDLETRQQLKEELTSIKSAGARKKI